MVELLAGTDSYPAVDAIEEELLLSKPGLLFGSLVRLFSMSHAGV